MRQILSDLWEHGVVEGVLLPFALQLRRFIQWYVTNARQTVPGTLFGLFAFWLAKLVASVETTHRIMNWALGPLGMPVFYIIVVGGGVLYGLGLIEFKSPMDRR